MKKERDKSFIWKLMKISFWIMIVSLILSIIFKNSDPESLFIEILSLIFIISIIFTLITSIVNLKRFNSRAFTIISLVISTLLLIIFLIGVVIILAAQIT